MISMAPYSAAWFAAAAAYAGVAAALLAAAIISAVELRASLRRWDREDRLAAGATAAWIAAAWWLAGGTSLRGGHNNEHDFLHLASRFFPLGAGGLAELLGGVEKELAPAAWLSLVDLWPGRSLERFLLSQKLLWAANAFLSVAFLRRCGVSAPGSVVGAAALSLSFLSILHAHAFSVVIANVSFMLLAALALVSLTTAVTAAQARLRWVWLLACAYLSLTSRFEFVPVLIAGAALSSALDGGHWFRLVEPRRGAAAACGVLFLALSAAWLHCIGVSGHDTWSVLAPWHNMRHHLGARNLSVLTGLHPAWGAAAGTALLAGAALLAARRPRFGTLFLAGWALMYAVAFFTPGFYVLQMMRHHLYVFLPFALLAGCLYGRLSSRPAAVFAALGLPLYLAANLAAIERHQADLRTNDREWQFLLAAVRDWPAGCRAAHPFRVQPGVEDSRAALFDKYFPGGSSGSCVFFYRSPRDQVIDYHGPIFAAYDKTVERLYGAPLRESIFTHRFYTDWHGPWHSHKAELLSATPVRAGFYHPSPEGRAALALPPGTPDAIPRSPVPDPQALPIRSESKPYRLSVESCFSRGSSALVDALDWSREVAAPHGLRCFDEALARETRPEHRAELHFARAGALDALGRRQEAIAALRSALAEGDVRWNRRPAVIRALARLGER